MTLYFECRVFSTPGFRADLTNAFWEIQLRFLFSLGRLSIHSTTLSFGSKVKPSWICVVHRYSKSAARAFLKILRSSCSKSSSRGQGLVSRGCPEFVPRAIYSLCTLGSDCWATERSCGAETMLSDNLHQSRNDLWRIQAVSGFLLYKNDVGIAESSLVDWSRDLPVLCCSIASDDHPGGFRGIWDG